MRGIICAAVVLWASVGQAVEVTFDSNGYAPFDDLLISGNYIDVGHFRWSDFSITDASYTPPAGPVSTAGVQLQLNSSARTALNMDTDTRTGGTQSYTYNTTISKIGAGRQIGQIAVSAVAAFPGTDDILPPATAVITGSGGVLATLNAWDSFYNTFARFPGEDSVQVAYSVETASNAIDGLRIEAIPVPMAGSSVDIYPGREVTDGVLGGLDQDGGIQFRFFNVLTPGTFTATPTIVPTSELSQSALDSLPYTPGETFTSYDFSYTGEFAPGTVGFITAKYDPETLGIPASAIRVFHQKDGGEWEIVPYVTVNEALGLITWEADSFSSFSIGQLQTPEPSTVMLLLFGLPFIRKRHGCLRPS